MALPAIEFQNVTVQFGDEVVLKNVSFQILEGETFVMVGPSGTGKSVTLKVMGGLIPPTSGKVLVRGHNMATLSGATRHELLCKMGMLFQKNALFDSLSNADNIAFPLREVGSFSETEIDAKVNFFLDAVGIRHAKELFPDEISGGMQKRLGIARALALDPEIIFYDDPTAGLDPITSRKIVDLINDIKKRKKATVVAVTNDMNRAYQMGDRIAMVVDKSILVTGNVSETKNHQDPRVHQFIRGDLVGPLTALT